MSIEKYPSAIPAIKTGNLLLRELTLSDREDVFEYASISEVTKYVIWEVHLNKEDSEKFILYLHDMFTGKEQLVWAIVYLPDNKVVGTIGYNSFKWEHKCAEIGYVVSKEYWNKGIASEALKLVLKYGFEELGLNRQEAHCKEENTASEKVMLKSGMKYEGALREKIFMKGEFWTMRLYSILKNEYNDKN